MVWKPFSPPLLNKPGVERNTASKEDFLCPQPKRRKIGPNDDLDDEEKRAHVSTETCSNSHASVYTRRPLHNLSTSVPSLSHVGETPSNAQERHYNVLWRKPSFKKHKTWDGDGLLFVTNGLAYLRDVSGREMGKTSCEKPLLLGSNLTIGGKEVEVESLLSHQDFLANKTFLGTVGKPTVQELEQQLRNSIQPNENVPRNGIRAQMLITSQNNVSLHRSNQHSSLTLCGRSAQNDALKSHFKTPLIENTVLAKCEAEKVIPRHDPESPGALVMKRPTSFLKGKHIVDVVVDPHIAQKLREHQREGVKFMYECVMGMRSHGGEGAILADEMGLGKTLQVIALLWTMLKQNPFYNEPPIIKKALIVCPVTLIKNWRKEFRKWLGNERIGVFVVDDNKKRITDFTMGRAYSVMIIGYEKLRTVQSELQKGSGIDIVIADEGHRLKTAQNKSAQAIKSLPTERRIILSGTPLQNDLSEFYFMVDFVNPGLLEKPGVFKREFETPILKSRQPEACPKDIEKGEARSAELAALTSKFILRRTAEILTEYLPSKTETILFCRPTSAQAAVYRNVLASSAFGTILGSPEASLKLIDMLKKLCNSPSLLRGKYIAEEQTHDTINSLLSDVSPGLLRSPGASGKLQVLDSILHRLRSSTEEKVVIVSNYTATLDILQHLLESLSYSFLRLDGSTNTNKRQSYVDNFNKSDAKGCFAFLLSAKAGGAGLNLIGASRLILFDVDWNPSTDLQAMARIHRDGQRRPCKIYRLLTMGALDEKIYQRQLTKRSLADSVVGNKVSASNFTRQELRRLFAFDESGKCQTHELLGCQCGGNGKPVLADALQTIEVENASDEDDTEPCQFPPLVSASKIDIDAQEKKIKEQGLENNICRGKILELMRYQHFDSSNFSNGIDNEIKQRMDDDDVLLDVLTDKENRVAYLFRRTTS